MMADGRWALHVADLVCTSSVSGQQLPGGGCQRPKSGAGISSPQQPRRSRLQMSNPRTESKRTPLNEISGSDEAARSQLGGALAPNPVQWARARCGRRSCLRTTRCGMRWRAADRERFCPTRPPAAELRCGCAVDRCGCPLDGRLLRRSVRGSRANMDRQSWCLSPRYLVISCGQPQVGDTRLIAQCCGDRLTR